jgi:hypothetical protein
MRQKESTTLLSRLKDKGSNEFLFVNGEASHSTITSRDSGWATGGSEIQLSIDPLEFHKG